MSPSILSTETGEEGIIYLRRGEFIDKWKTTPKMKDLEDFEKYHKLCSSSKESLVMKRNWLSVCFSQPNWRERRRTRWIWVAVEESTAESRAGTSCILASTPFRLATCLLDPHSCSCPSLTKSPIRLSHKLYHCAESKNKIMELLLPQKEQQISN